MTNKGHNRLENEKSLHLKRHCKNPVNWWIYGPEAIQEAADKNMPIFLSIGSSSCHWCHLMEKESFSDTAVAETLNNHFISIKIDLEELPDIDTYYQQACHLFNQMGGHPLTAFLLPDLKPFFVGTYFPAESNDELIFKDLVVKMANIYKDEHNKVMKNAFEADEKIKDGIVPKDRVEYHGHFPHPMSIMNAIKEFRDLKNGGYGEAPKFPNVPFYEWAVEQILEGMIDKEEGKHVVDSLEKMLLSGLYDHSRGGIHRYTLDDEWMVPCFEKLLYLQADILKLLSKLTLVYPSPLAFDTILNTLDYLENEMMSDDGYFFSGQDADSEEVNGLYYTFSRQEFENILNNDFEKDSQKIKKWFNMDQNDGQDSLKTISLNQKYKNEFLTTDGWELVRQVRSKITEERKLRIPPATDLKGVASWNFMLISALADVVQYCHVDVIKNRGMELLKQLTVGAYKTFITSKDSERLQIRHCTTRENAFPHLEDYVYFADAELRSYEVTGNITFKENLLQTLQYIIDEFLENDKIFTRAKSCDDSELYHNIPVNAFDNSFHSPASTLISIVRRANLLFPEQELGDAIEKLQTELAHECLKNPLNAGEALRALSYPDEAYRIIKIPKSWLGHQKFMTFIPYFLPRFVLDYHEEGDGWQICNSEKCELQGEGLDDFIKTLTPQKKSS